MKAAITVLLFLSLLGLSVSVYRNHFFVKKLVNWKDAQTYCREYHDDLSTINKEEAQMLSKNPEVNNDFFWIGPHRSPTSSEKWIWSGGEDEKIDYWDTGQPDMNNQECGAVNKYSTKLHNVLCWRKIPFYCMQVFEPILVRQNKTWDEALDYCRQNYNDLASLRSRTKMAEVINNTMTSQTAYVWTGLRFMAGHWFWVSGHNLQYKAWSAEGELQCPAGNLRCGALKI